ncbi:MAG: bifunctional folylpolyglutamate synthase/dihydrofolate synthase [Oscillospiraceae bacterium]|jgi:dihydrofolate synthase/folylpolyglutamate synthase|nr:bifunctional folylpolyglutamate synthase/dihydrofolate synthase [Oscillospiraceae bacterium]
MFDYLEFFHSLNRFGSRPGLYNIGKLCECLGSPERSLRFIHVAGTNGKGSVCTFLSEILQAAGCKTGLYISPYVTDFRERVQINGQMVDEATLATAAETVKNAVLELNQEDIIITEFEAVTAAAFLCFASQRCDAVVLETGLGGRFDATNIIPPPLVSVITSISLDHTQILGSTVAEIAFEKCGIIKQGSSVVTNNAQPNEALAVIQKTAAERGARLSIATVKNKNILNTSIFGTEILYNGEPLSIPLAGEHQIENALTAIEAVHVLQEQGFHIADAYIRAGVAQTQMPARIQILSREPLIILDGSHNDGSTKALSEVLKTHLPQKKLLGLMGMMADKDYAQALQNLAPLFASLITATPGNPRSLSAEALAAAARQVCPDARAIPSPAEAFAQAKEQLGGYDALIICGSLYLAADILGADSNIYS